MARNKKRSTDQAPTISRKKLIESMIVDAEDRGILVEGKAPRIPRLATTTMHGAYTKGFNSPDFFGTKITYPTLRRVAKNSGLHQAIISRRGMQMMQIAKKHRFDGDIGFKVVHDKHYEHDFKVPQQLQDLCRDVERMINNPWGYLEPTFGGFCTKFVQDLCIINRPAIELGLNSKGVPVTFGMIDGANVYPTFDALKTLVPAIESKYGRVLDKNEKLTLNSPSYDKIKQAASDAYGLNIEDATEYIYLQDLIPRASYKLNEIVLIPMMPTTDINEAGFPPSMTERSIRMILAEMLAMSYNMNYFQFGTMIDSMIGIVGSYDDEHVKELVETIRMNHSGVDGAHRMPIVPVRNPEDIHVYNLRQNNRDMVYGDFMNLVTSLTCAIFGMPPEDINIKQQNGTGGRAMFEASNAKIVMNNKEEGLYAIRNHIKTCLDIGIIKKIHPELCFEWFGFDDDVEKIKKENAQKELSVGGITKREYRLMTGKEPVPENMEDKDVDMFEDQAWLQMKQVRDQQEQMEKMQSIGGTPNEGDSGPEDPEKYNKDYFEESDDDYEEPDYGLDSLEEDKK